MTLSFDTKSPTLYTVPLLYSTGLQRFADGRGAQLVGLGGAYPAAPIPSFIIYIIPSCATTSPTVYTFPLSYGLGGLLNASFLKAFL